MRRHLRYLSNSVLDQAAASIMSLLLSICVLRLSTVREASEFSLAFIAFGLCHSLARSLTSEPMAVFVKAEEVDGSSYPRTVDAGHVIVSLGLGALGAIGFGIGFSIHTDVGVCALICAALATGAGAVRTDLIALALPRLAFVISAIQLIGVAIGSVAATIWGTPLWSLIGWGCSAFLVIVWTLVSVGLSKLGSGFAPETWGYLGEFLVTAGASQGAVLLGISFIDPILAVASRVGTTSYGPYQTIFQVVSLAAIPFFRRVRPGMSSRAQVFLLTTLLAICYLGWSTVALWVLPSHGDDIFGVSVWASIAPFMLFYALSLMPTILTTPLFVAVRATGRVGPSFALRACSGVSQLGFPLFGGLIDGIRGFYIGACFAGLLTAVIGFFFIRVYGKSP